MPIMKSATVNHKHSRVMLHSIPMPQAPVIQSATYFRWKRFLGGAMAALLLIPGLPMIVLLALLVQLTSRGPGIYRQRRVGKNGRDFMLYKIRTMKNDAEAGTGATWAQARDFRVTGIGKALRRLHLDELPQLINVLKGEMALIGPRPERPEFVHVLAAAIPGYSNRQAVLPGITGLAQLNLPPDTDLNSVRRKLVLDFEYIQHANLWLDIRIFFCTFARMFKLPSTSLFTIAGIHRTVTLPADNLQSSNGSNGSSHLGATPDSIAAPIEASTAGDGKASKGGANGSGSNHGETYRPKPR
jgi:lipopolysaccharide/colanic/teichoic acid biosynthesis glycosyltransferase